MEILKGVPASPGYAVAKALVLDVKGGMPVRRYIDERSSPEKEIERFRRAVRDAKEEMLRSEMRFRDVTGGDVEAIFKSHLMMLDDPRMHAEVEERIRRMNYTAEFAVTRVIRRYVKLLEEMDDEYYSNRVVDLQDVEKRLLSHLVGSPGKAWENLEEDVIVVARNLTPSQTSAMRMQRVKGFATERGGITSHTAIIARSIGLPAVVGVQDLISEVEDGQMLVLDGTGGMVIVNPDKDTLERYGLMQETFTIAARRMENLRDLPAETKDGVRISLLANVEFPSDIDAAMARGAEGIGLYRTEFLYARGTPSEEDHFAAYADAVKKVGNKPLTIRTLDLGADKFEEEVRGHERERNPFLGCRSIRYCLENPAVLRVQLRAILRASAMGNVRLLLPMISSHEELLQMKEIVEDVKEELRRKGEAFDENIPIGIMVEVPSVALVADIMADEVDYMSIGTNDLIQYMLAVDRTNERVAYLYTPAHPAVLRVVKAVVDAGRSKGTPVAMCGEMSSDVEYTVLLLGLGLREFSVSPAALLNVKRVIRAVSMKDAEAFAEEVLSLPDATAVEEVVARRMSQLVPGGEMG